MAIILTKSMSSANASGSGVFSQLDKLALELEMGFKTANLSNYKEFEYTDSILSSITIYTDDTKGTTLFRKNLTYDINDILTQVMLTRVSPSAALIKSFAYDGNNNLSTIGTSGVTY